MQAPLTPPPAIMTRDSGHTPESALAAIMNHARSPGGPLSPGASKPKYEAKTQADHSIAIHIVNPNGSLGPVVKIVPPIKSSAK